MTDRWPRPARAVAGWPALGAGLLALSLWAGAAIPRNVDWQEPEDGITILIETNGTHTGIVVPLVTDGKDWRETFPHVPQYSLRGPVTHLAIGWGEREVFLHTPTWGDLKLSTALRVAISGGDSVMRLHPYVRPAPGPWHRPLTLRPAEYARLAAAIERSLPPVAPDERREHLPGFDPAAINYAALGRYTLSYSCNQWVADVLAEAGVKVGWWTPLAGGVTRWFPQR